MRYRAVIEYDGAAYCGFQRQRNQPSIQAEFEQVLGKLSGQPVGVLGAGRTDSGVHAWGQVIAFDLGWQHGPEKLQRALNASLPADIAVRRLEAEVEEFHPRFQAERRTYVYTIYNHPVRSPLRERWSWHVPRPLAVDAMQAAADLLIGVRDFATFGQPTEGESTTRQVYRAQWDRRGDELTFLIEANAFLYRMVRSLVGSLKAVGEGAWTAADFAAALAARDRGRAGQTAPPQGLALLEVRY
ncbi:MAG: tRNA pseudouridine(38-40) synthase TruA [Candidatus Promineifilaceae bacterium]